MDVSVGQGFFGQFQEQNQFAFYKFSKIDLIKNEFQSKSPFVIYSFTPMNCYAKQLATFVRKKYYNNKNNNKSYNFLVTTNNKHITEQCTNNSIDDNLHSNWQSNGKQIKHLLEKIKFKKMKTFETAKTKPLIVISGFLKVYHPFKLEKCREIESVRLS